MKHFTFENQGNNTYLVYPVAPGDEIDEISLGMLTNNRIPGFAETIFSQLDTQKFIKYNVSSKVSLNHLLSGVVTRRRLMKAFIGVLDAMISAEEYMLDPELLLLDLDYIFSDISTGETVLVCLPVTGEHNTVNLGAFFKKIMFGTQFDQNENCDYVAKIINYLNKVSTVSAPDFKQTLLALEAEEQKARATKSAHHTEPIRREPQAPIQQKQAAAATQQPHEALSSNSVRKVESPHQYERSALAHAASDEPAKKATEVKAQTPPPEGNGEKMSMLYLLRHYSKENAAIYKAQKQGAKADSKNGEPKEKQRDNQKTEKNHASVNMGFDMPGQSINPPASHPAPVAQPALIPQPIGEPRPISNPKTAPSQQAVPAMSVELQTEETGFMDDGSEETVIMGLERETQRLTPHLIRRKNNERIPIDKEIFRLGRDAEFNDYAIVDNRFVGHSHCHIVCRDGEFFAIDDNSRNHTKVNGTQIKPGEEVKLAHDFVLSVADEEFEFKLF